MDELKELLGDELYNELSKKLEGKSLIIDDGKLIPKHRFDCVNISLKEHKDEVKRLTHENARLNDIASQSFKRCEEFSKLKKENTALAEVVSRLLPYKLSADAEANK